MAVSNGDVTFIGSSNVMISNKYSSECIGFGNSLWSENKVVVTFSGCVPGTDLPGTISQIPAQIPYDFVGCKQTPQCCVANKARAATVTCTSLTDNQLDGDCDTGYWKDTTGLAHVCKPHTVCGKQLLTSVARPLSGHSLTAAGTCDPCDVNTWAANDETDCIADTVCLK